MSNSLPLFHFQLPPSQSCFQDKQQSFKSTHFDINNEKLNRLERISFDKKDLKQENTNEINNKISNDNLYLDHELIFQIDDLN